MPEKKTEETTKDVAEAVRETSQIITKSVIAAQERNMKFVQTTFTNAMEVMKSHVEASRALMHELEQQQEALQKLVPGMENYMAMLRAPLTSYQKALDAAEKSTKHGLETFEKALKDFEKATKQEKTTHPPQ